MTVLAAGDNESHTLREGKRTRPPPLLTESATLVREHPGKETREEGGWVLWPAATCPQDKS